VGHYQISPREPVEEGGERGPCTDLIHAPYAAPATKRELEIHRV